MNGLNRLEEWKIPKYNKYIGKPYGRFTIKKIEHCIIYGKAIHPVATCVCKCGEEKLVRLPDLKSGQSQSCKCLLKEYINGNLNRLTHGLWDSPEYKAFHDAKARCTKENRKGYKNYGGRGIKFKLNSVEDIINDIGKRPSNDYSLDRKDNNGHYEIGNLRWATKIEQNNNTQRN